MSALIREGSGADMAGRLSAAGLASLSPEDVERLARVRGCRESTEGHYLYFWVLPDGRIACDHRTRPTGAYLHCFVTEAL